MGLFLLLTVDMNLVDNAGVYMIKNAMAAVSVILATGHGLSSASIQIHGITIQTELVGVCRLKTFSLNISKESLQWALEVELICQMLKILIKKDILLLNSSEDLCNSM